MGKYYLIKNCKYITAILGILVILFFRDTINGVWLKAVGVPLLGNIQSSIFNDCICILLVTLGVILITIRKIKKDGQKITLEKVFCVIVFCMLYYYQRISFTNTFVPFYLFPHIVYADIVPILLFFCILRIKIKKSSEETISPDVLASCITNYLDDNSDQYAIMLSGEYGIGKTYYYEQTVKKIIKNKRKEPIYISVYGIKSQDDLHRKFFEEIHPIIKGSFFHLFSNILNALSSFFGGNINLNKTEVTKSLDIDWNNYVICIDDLERIAQTDCITEFFGYLNDLLVNHKVKILFIANEEQLNDGNKHSDYKRNKEKLVQFTYQYTCNIIYFIETYANNEKNTQFSEYLNSVKERIDNFYHHHKLKNLRTLKFNIYILKQIYNYLQNNYEQELLHALINKKYLFLTMVYSAEYKAKNNLDIFPIIDIEKSRVVLYRKYYGNLLPSTNVNENVTLTTEDCIVDKYWGMNYHLYDYSESLTHYITTGTLNQDEFDNETKLLAEEIRIEEETKKKDLLTKLENPWQHEDAEMQVNIEDALFKLEKGDVGVKDYPAFIHALSIIDENGFANVWINENSVQERIREGLTNRMKKELDNGGKDASTEYSYTPYLQLKRDEFYVAIEEVVFNFFKENKERIIRDEFHNRLRLAVNQEISLGEFNDYDFDLFFFDKITPEVFFDIIITCNNKVKMEISNFIRYRIHHKNEFDAIFYKQLIEIIDVYLNKNQEPCVSRKIIELLLKVLKGEMK